MPPTLIGSEAGNTQYSIRSGDRGSLVIDREGFRVTLDGTDISLTRTEFEILTLLSERPGRVLTYTVIAELVWGSSEGVDKSAIEVHVSRLRRKLGECGESPRFIHNVRGVGYRFQLPHTKGREPLPVATFLWNDEWELVQIEVADPDVVPIEPREVLGTHFIPPLRAQSPDGEGGMQLAARLAVGLGIRRAIGTSSMRLSDGRRVAVSVDCEFVSHEGVLMGTQMRISMS